MFRRNPKLASMINRVYALTRDLDRGDTLTHEAIRKVLGVPPNVHPWGYVLDRVRRRLLEERGIATWPVPTVGYRLETVGGQLEIPTRRMRRAIRQVRRSLDVAEALPEEDLSVHQRQVRTLMVGRLLDAEGQARDSLRAQSRLLSPTPAQPRTPMPV